MYIPYIANIGCAASHREALELSPNVTCITVKDKSRQWEPTPEETYPMIYESMLEALKDYNSKTGYPRSDKYICKLNLTDGYYFDEPDNFPWKGEFNRNTATWEAHDIETSLSLFWRIQDDIKHYR